MESLRNLEPQTLEGEGGGWPVGIAIYDCSEANPRIVSVGSRFIGEVFRAIRGFRSTPVILEGNAIHAMSTHQTKYSTI
ncbi:hypothetical protein Syun_024763 [Stephania yunnanensis]|uniref:Uncharacterized protein n=1 Tax=Stephania yunnanensis TaxID=152371 RepID=A0AAP0EXH0_9MAGN